MQIEGLLEYVMSVGIWSLKVYEEQIRMDSTDRRYEENNVKAVKRAQMQSFEKTTNHMRQMSLPCPANFQGGSGPLVEQWKVSGIPSTPVCAFRGGAYVLIVVRPSEV